MLRQERGTNRLTNTHTYRQRVGDRETGDETNQPTNKNKQGQAKKTRVANVLYKRNVEVGIRKGKMGMIGRYRGRY